jgi:integrase
VSEVLPLLHLHGMSLSGQALAAVLHRVQARLGHASASETLDTYSHLWPDSEDRTRSAVDSVLGSVANPLPEETTNTL